MWILPTVTFLVLVAYAGLAIVFYNKDGWFDPIAKDSQKPEDEFQFDVF